MRTKATQSTRTDHFVRLGLALATIMLVSVALYQFSNARTVYAVERGGSSLLFQR